MVHNRTTPFTLRSKEQIPKAHIENNVNLYTVSNSDMEYI